jgi:nitroreductase/SAM-dependent methyltransferase
MTEAAPAPTDVDTVLASMASRYSVREFVDRPIDPAVIDAIIADGIEAPSSCNQQVWHFVVVSEPELKERMFRISGVNAHLLHASATIYLCFHKGWFHDKFSVVQSVSAATYHMILSAHARGFATIWNAGIGDTREVAAALGIPPAFEIQGAICIGYAKDSAPRLKPPRRPVETIRSWNRFERPDDASYPLKPAAEYPYWRISNAHNPFAIHDPKAWGWERIASFRGYSVWHKSPTAGVLVPPGLESALELEVAALPDLEPDARILEVMPYGGTYSTMLRKRFGPAVHLHLAELSEHHGRFIEERLTQEGLPLDNIHHAVIDKGRLAYPDDHFDAAFLPQVLEGVPEPEVLLDEIRRVLKPGGRAVISVRNSLSHFGISFARKLRRQSVTNFGPFVPISAFAVRTMLSSRFEIAGEFGISPTPGRPVDRVGGFRRNFSRLFVTTVLKAAAS